MSIAKHTAANIVGGLAPLVVAIVTVPLFLRYVGPERYGVLAVLWALLGYFTFFDFGFGRAVSQRMSKLSASSDAASRSALLWTGLAATALLGVLGSLLLAVFADFLLTEVIKASPEAKSEAVGAIKWLLPALPVILLASVLRGALVARLRFVELNAIEVLTSVLTQTLPLAAAAAGFVTLDIIVPVTLGARLLSTVLLFWRCRGAVPIITRPSINSNDAARLLQYGGWVFLISMVAPILVTSDRVIIATVLGAAFVPAYTIPFDLVTKVMIITAAVSGALFPRLAAASVQDACAMATKATDILVTVMTPVIIVGVFLIAPFLHVWMGADFSRSNIGVPETLLIGIWFNLIGAAQQSRLLGADNPRGVALAYIGQVPIYLGLLWTGIHYGGLLGAAAAWSVRALMEMSLLLALSGSLTRAALAPCIVPGVLVLSSLATILVCPLGDWRRWAAGATLLVLALLTRRSQLRTAITLLLRPRSSGISHEGSPVQPVTATALVGSTAVNEPADLRAKP